MNPLKLPKPEEVKSFDLGDTTVHLVEITEDNASYLGTISALMMIAGRKCRYCQVEFEPEDIDDVVYAAHPGEPSQIAHSECFKLANVS